MQFVGIGLCQHIRLKLFAFFLDTEYYYAATSVCKSAVRFPKRARETALGSLEFQFGIFCSILKIVKYKLYVIVVEFHKRCF